MSLASVLATMVYALVVFACGAAALAARARGRPARQTAGWLACAAAFAALAMVRLLDVEDRAREVLRRVIRGAGSYEERAFLQLPLVVLTLAGGLVMLLFAYRLLHRRNADRGRTLVCAALVAVAAFVPLYALRTISWHPVDSVLYSGPVRLNWILDLGLSALVGGAALLSLLPQGKAPQAAGRLRSDQER